MKTIAELSNRKFLVKMMCIGASGTGKTHLAATFPKTYFLSTEPGGMDTIMTNQELRKNLVGCEELIPNSPADTARIFQEISKATLEAKQLAKEGKIETLVLDNMTFLSENRWIYIEQFEKELTNSGAVNTMAMYGKLARWLYQFTLMELLTFPGNVVITAHEQLESDEALDKKPDKTTPVLANILGGFRDKVDGMFSLVFYLSKMKEATKYRYFARTNKGNSRNAKSRIPLPEIIEDISYVKLMEVINQTLKQKEVK